METPAATRPSLYGFLKPLDPKLSPIALRSQTSTFDGQAYTVKLTVGESGRAYLTTATPRSTQPLTTLLRDKDTFMIAGNRYRFCLHDENEAALAAVAVTATPAAPLFSSPLQIKVEKENDRVANKENMQNVQQQYRTKSEDSTPTNYSVSSVKTTPMHALSTPVSVQNAFSHAEGLREKFTPVSMSDLVRQNTPKRILLDLQPSPEKKNDRESLMLTEKLSSISAALSRSKSNIADCATSLRTRLSMQDKEKEEARVEKMQTVSVNAEQVRQLKEEHTRLRFEVMQTMAAFSQDLENGLMSIVQKLDTDHESAMLKKRLAEERAERKRLHNALMEAQGNIRVHCRIRPLLERDDSECVMPGGEDTVHVLSKDGVRTKGFEFDEVYAPHATEEDVFSRVEPLVTSFADGYNVCIVAYGQTSSGKTHTMRGITQRAFASVLRHGRAFSDKYEMSMFEIYNENIRDLLEDKPTQVQKTENLRRIRFANAAEGMRIIEQGEQRRAKCATLLNEHSSRSHSIVAIFNGRSKLMLVDLAGSECVSKSGVEGTALLEAKYVNRSLSAFGDVLQALSMQRSHVPYRNSRLTHVLSDCLGGDAKMLLLVTVSPAMRCAGESVHSLGFGVRARQCKRGAAPKMPVGQVAGFGDAASGNTTQQQQQQQQQQQGMTTRRDSFYSNPEL